ncbi:acyl-CoA thioester hydrolase/BAAT C-terminal domain-containing protein [Aurantiacibacter spongiae]|uniref:acyl-CoA thioester hydrolase/BAAT C-terminal domain-containing protein n=1 Tax=Aurantiacibacter spongiae TaxID=2488860 RepID=UPI00389967EA
MDVPILVLAGAEDGIWPSWISAERIRQRLVAAGKSDIVEVRTYPGAGHSLVSVGFGGPFSVFAYNPSLEGYMDFGGTPNGNCDAGFQSSRAVVEFLEAVDRSTQQGS